MRLTNDKIASVEEGSFVSASREEIQELVKNAPSIEQLYKKLAEYEKAEEEGRLLLLPFKGGETVYMIEPDERSGGPDYLVKGHIQEIDVYKLCNESVYTVKITIIDERGRKTHRDLDDLNGGLLPSTAFFLSEKEAREALKKINEKTFQN